LTTASDVFTGGPGNDTFNALVGTGITGSGTTFGSNDILDGGAGTDTLFIQNNSTGVAGPATLSNIENIQANFSAAGSINLLGAQGVLSIESNGSSAAASFTSIGDATNILRVSNTATDTSFGFTSAAVAGAGDTAKVVLSAVTGGTLSISTGFEAISIDSANSANTLTALSVAGTPSKITVTGSQALNLGSTALPASVTSFDASGNTATGAGVTATLGAVTVANTITGGSGNDTFNVSSVAGAFSVSGGAGNDTIREDFLRATDTISGGDGAADVLSTTAAPAEGYATPSTRTISGFEQLTLSNAGTAAATLVVANVDTGIARVNLGAGTAGAYTITGAVGSFDVRTSAALGGTLTLNTTGTATTDSVSLVAAPVTGTVDVFGGRALTASKYETVTINSGSAVTATQTLGAVSISADTGGSSALKLIGVNSITTGTVTAVSIDASGMSGAGAFSNTGAGATTTSITGTANSDIIVGGSAGATLTGGAGADTITGGAGNDSIVGGDGADVITGGLGRDTLTGGAGVDTFQFGVNAIGAIVSTASNATDTITDFTSGTDRLSISQPITDFIGNFVNFTIAQAAANADGRGNLAYFVTSENTLYVQASATSGLTTATDTVITLSGVASIARADLLLGAQGTVGNATVAVSAPGSSISTSSATNATTAFDDVITSTAENMVRTTIDGGAGADSLTISSPPSGALSLANVSNVERIVFAAGSAGAITLPNTPNLAVSNSSTTVGMTTVTMGTGATQSFTSTGGFGATVTLGGGIGQSASLSGGVGANIVNLGAAGQSATTSGLGSNTISTTVANALGSTFTGGAGTTDVLSVTDAGTITLVATAVAGTSSGFSAIDRIDLTGASILNITPSAAITFITTGATTIAGTGTGGTITAAANNVGALTLNGTSNFAVTAATGVNTAVSSSSTGSFTFTPTGTANNTLTTSSASTASVIHTLAAAATGTTILAGTANWSVTGLGIGGGAAVTEDATHTTGTLTVGVAGTSATTVTLNAAGTGAVLVNDAHTTAGVTTVATSSLIGRSVTVNVTGATGNTTITGSNATAVNVNNVTAGSHSIIGGSGADTIAFNALASSGAAQTVVGGLGADNISFAGTVSTVNPRHIITIDLNDTGVVPGLVPATQILNTTGAFNVAAADKVTGFNSVMEIRFGGGLTTFGTSIARNGLFIGGSNAANGTAADFNTAMIVGNYDATTQQFTVNSAGTSTLLAYDKDGTGAGTAYNGVVLVGYVDGVGNDNMATTGVLGAVAG
jgi:Ca2+-binding RTX toxin-like protein